MKKDILPSLFDNEPEEIIQPVIIEEKPKKKIEKRIVSLASLEKKFSKIVAACFYGYTQPWAGWR